MKKLLLILIMLLYTAMSSWSAIINVPADQPTIAAAVAVANPNDVIQIASGSFPITSTIVISDANLTITGAGIGATFITGGITAGENFFQVLANGFILQDIEMVKTDKPGMQNLIWINANNVSILDNSIHGQFVIGDGDVSRALVVSGGLSGLTVSGNTFYALRQPMYLTGITTGIISNNYTYNTKGWVLEGGDVTFTGNTWGVNVYDIAILNYPANTGYYTDIVAMSNANNEAVIEDQRPSSPVLSVVYVDAAAAAGGAGGRAYPYQTIGLAIPRVVAGGKIKVAGGIYTAEYLTANKSFTMLGANAGIHPAVGTNPTATPGTRVAESIISNLSPAADNVTIDGFKITKAGTRIIDTYADANYFTLRNCIVESTVYGPTTGVIQFGGGSHTNCLFEFNLFTDKGDHTFYAGGGPYDGLTFQYNKFQSESDAIFWAASPLVNGLILHNEFDGEAGSNYNNLNIGQAGNLQITNNWFHDILYTAIQVGIINGSITGNEFDNHVGLAGYNGSPIQLWGGEWGTALSTNVTISNNEINYNQNTVGSVHGIRLRGPNSPSDPKIDASTIHIHNNAFLNGGALTGIYAVLNQGDDTKTLDATCNWFGTTNPAVIATMFNSPASFQPYLLSGTDSQTGTIGFQPVAGTCADNLAYLETPVQVNCSLYDIPIRVENLTSVGAINMTIDYDPAIFEYQGVTWNTLITGASANAAGGEIVMGWFSVSGVTLPDPAILVTLHMKLKPAISGTVTPITWNNVPNTGNCEFGGPGGNPVYGTSFFDVFFTVPVRPVKNLNTLLEYCTIQAAIDDPLTLAGHDIACSPGTYPEMVDIYKSIHLQGYAGQVTTTFVQAPSTLPAASDPLSNIILVRGSGINAEISGLTIKGPGPTGCGSIGRGIFVRDGAYAYIHDNQILDVRDNPFSGCQNGIAIQVGRNFWSTTGTALIKDNLITGYQKGGIVVDNAGSNASIEGNIVTGAGTTNIIGQNGIQISRGATASLTGNTITGNSFQSAGHPDNYCGTGILLYQSGAVAMLGGNSLSGNDQHYYPYDVTGALTMGAEIFGPSAAPVTFGYYIVDYANQNINASNCTFEGIIPGSATLAQLFDIEDRIWHSADDQARTGFALVKPGNVYITHTETGAKVQYGVDAATPLDVVHVKAATYSENVIVNKDLTMEGANFGNPCYLGRAPESIISASGGAAMTVLSDGVTIDGFSITNPAGSYAVYAEGRSNLAVINNVISQVGTASTSGATHAICIVMGSAANINGITITGNCINDVHGGESPTLAPTLSNGSASGIGVGWSNANYDVTNLLIQNNIISDISACIAAGSNGGKGAYGIIINVGASSGNAGKAVNPIVRYNTISGLHGLWAHGIGLEGETPGAVVENNDINNLVDHKSPSDAIAVKVEDNDGAATVGIHDNSFTSTSWGVVNASAGLVSATCNWYGTLIAADIAGKVFGNITYINWLVSGVDQQSPASLPGFLPPTNQCLGSPMVVIATTVTPESCPCSYNGAIDITVTGGSGSYTYLWSPGGQTSQDLSGLTGGTYTITVTDTWGNIVSLPVLVPTTPDVTAPGITCPAPITQATDAGRCDAKVTWMPEVTYVQNYGTNAYSACQHLWQSFTATATGVLTQVDLFPHSTVGPTWNVTIYDGEGETGCVLYNDPTFNPTGNPIIFTIPRSVGVYVVAGQKYTISIAGPCNPLTCEVCVDVYVLYNGGAVVYTGGKYWDNMSMGVSPTSCCPPSTVLFPDGLPNNKAALGATYHIDSMVPTFAVSDNCRVKYVTCSPQNGSTFSLGGPTTVTATATDFASLSTSCNFSVTIVDQIPPTISCPADVTTAKTSDDGTGNCETTVALSSPITGDNCTVVSTKAYVGAGEINPTTYKFGKGNTTVTWKVTDGSSNTAQCNQLVTVSDDEKPVISLTGDATVELCKGEPYTDAGATALDNCDGNITANIVTTGLPINVNNPNTYTVTYNVTDAALNSATEVTRTVVVKALPVVSNAGMQYSSNGGGSWTPMTDVSPLHYKMCLDTEIPWYILDISTLTSVPDLQTGYLNPFTLNYSLLGAEWMAYWTGKGLTSTNDPLLWAIVHGNAPIFYIYKTIGGDYQLIDGYLHQLDGISMLPLRVEGTYPPLDYSYNGNVKGDNGCFSSFFDVFMDFRSIPVITCPSNITVNNDPGICGASVAFAASATGIPAPAITYTIPVNVTITSPYVFPVGTTVVTAKAENECGTDICTFSVTVIDNEAPDWGAPIFRRDMPIANLNNAAGPNRSNVAWADGVLSTEYYGDDFKLPPSPEGYWTINKVIAWGVAGDVDDPNFDLEDYFNNIELYGGVATQDPWTGPFDGSVNKGPINMTTVSSGAFTGNAVTTADGTVITVKEVTYNNGQSYQRGSGQFRRIWQVTFDNLNWTVADQQLMVYGVNCTHKFPADQTKRWFNHYSNYTQGQGSTFPWTAWDGLFVDFSPVPPPPARDIYILDPVAGGWWDKGNDHNVLIYGAASCDVAINGCLGDAPVGPTAEEMAALFADNCPGQITSIKHTTVTGNDCDWDVKYSYEISDAAGNVKLPWPSVNYSGGDQEAPVLSTPVVINRPLPASNLNNSAGANRSNVAWAEDPNPPDFDGDDFTMPATSVSWTINKVTVWAVAGKISTYPNIDLSTLFSSISLYGGPAPVSSWGPHGTMYPSAPATTLMSGNFDGNSTTNPNIVITRVHYAGGSDYESSSGSMCYIWKIDFNNLNWVVPGGQKMVYGVDCPRISPTGPYWFNHYSNSTYGGVPADQADGLFPGMTKPAGGLWDVTIWDPMIPGWWDKGSDGNIMVYAIPSAMIAECDAVPAAPVLTAADNCDPLVPVQFTEVRTDGNCPNNYILTRNWTASDDCLNQTSLSQVVTVHDLTPPTITACPPGNDIVGCSTTAITGLGYSETPVPVSQFTFNSQGGSATDNCGNPVYWEYKDVAVGTCPIVVNRTWTVKDACGNPQTCVQVITITSPSVVFNCGSDKTEAACQSQTAIDDSFAAWLLTTTASGGCNGSLTTDPLTPTAPSACGGSKTVTWTYTSSCAPLTTSCTKTFTVTDAPAVVLTCPATANEAACQTQDAINGKFATWLTTVVASGGCNGSLTRDPVTPTPPSACGGSTTVTWTYTSTCAPLTSTCSATFNVAAPAAVALTCPATANEAACQTQEAINGKFTTWLGTVVASGGCNGSLTTDPVTPAPPSACGGSTTVTWTYTSTCAPLTSTCSATFNVATPAPPTITCPADVTVHMNNTCTATGVALGTPVTTGCNVTVVPKVGGVQIDPLTYPFVESDNYVTWVVTDGCSQTASCQQKVTVVRNKISGTLKYYNTPKTAMGNVTLKLSDGSTTSTAAGTGYYEFSGKCAGAYTITVANINKPVGYINSTDASAVNYWSSNNSSIQHVKFLAGDVAGDEFGPNDYISSNDALAIQNYFVFGDQFIRVSSNLDPAKPLLSSWGFWKAGELVNSNTDPNRFSPYPYIIQVGNVTDDTPCNIYGMGIGDFNGSFIPGSAKAASATLDLVYNETKWADASTEVNLPVRLVNSSIVGAVSLVLNFPSDMMEITSVTMDENNGKLDWSVNGNELRIGWNTLEPLWFEANANLLTIHGKTAESFGQGDAIRFTLAAEPANELADGSFNVIPDAVIGIDLLEFSTYGIVEPANGSGLTLESRPNPFTTYTTLSYNLPVDGSVTLEVSDMLGRKVTMLVDEYQLSGKYNIKLDAIPLQPGVYTAKLTLHNGSGDLLRTIKLVRQQ